MAGNGYRAPGGDRLLDYLNGLPVESRWLAGHHVTWMTGQQDRESDGGKEAKSHCSAFVAAAAMGLGIYVLRPPHFPQELLSNAQMEWLAGTGDHPGKTAAEAGWAALGTSGDGRALRDAVAAANAGQLVIAGYAAPPTTDDDGTVHKRPGHVCIVLPQDASAVGSSGPRVMSAGDRNWREALMKTAFVEHPDAWPDNVSLYACNTPLQVDA